MSGSGNIFYPRLKAGTKLSTRIDADGKEVEVEVREDEEQKVKLQEIIDILVAAGYFRARIKGLSAFDKVVGGMTWCIETCNFDVDVDLLFQENLTIGQKIALTEKIVAVLPEMKCPHSIEPHQIQGLDFIHIYPVIQWLVKKSVETRQEMGDFIRSYAVSQFHKLYNFFEEQNQPSLQEKILCNIQTVKNAYRPQRRFRRKDAPPEDEEIRVQSTLLEYGCNINSVIASKETDQDKGEEENGQPVSPEALDTQRLEESRLTAGVVGNIVNLQAQEIARAAERYAELQAGVEESKTGSPSTHARALVALTKQKAALEEREEKLSKEKENLESLVGKEVVHLQDIRLSRKQAEAALAEREALETPENQVILKKLQALVIMNERLKQQELQFREQCKTELSRLQKMVKDAQENATPDEDNDQIAKQFEDEQERVQKLRLLLAKRNRAIALLQRQLDEVPGRAELAQYQRRFLELYNQVAAKHKETKQFYTLYNTFDDTKLYVKKELTLLNSILDNYSEAMSSASGKEQFMKQFDAIVEGVKQNKAKVERRRLEERQRRDRLSQQLLGLVDQQRRYVAAVRQLTIECRRNETLLAQLRGT
ncbi:coiled-coil domain-containing protein 93 isoform X2 [Anabrus simplex]|uniref:coiled-coil domain-containing protein 93 isoform X2 n=1 Tax=Anabrus simplex TaxID=316456 RepID=UPI0035A2A495